MNLIALAILVAAQLNSISVASAADDACGRENFSVEELSNPYGPSRKVLRKYSRVESDRIAQSIVKNANHDVNGRNRACLPSSRSCAGGNRDWYFRKDLILDNFGNPLRFNGEISSKHFQDYAAEKYYAHRASMGYSCAWGGSLKPQCEKWCSLAVIDDRWHD